MIVADFEPVSLSDYPGKVSAVVFIAGCNLLCRFCYNRELVLKSLVKDKTEDFFEYLILNKIKYVAITGGEPLFHPHILDFLEKLKQLGVSIKLDTNGFSYAKLKKALEKSLLHYVAMDVKGFSDEDIRFITRKNYRFRDLLKSYELLKSYDIPFELRITMWKDFNKEDLLHFLSFVDRNDKIVLQKPLFDKPFLDKRFESFVRNVDFERNIKIFQECFSNVVVRNFV